MNSIITFYSFKGGVGRTMALANIAFLLARMGKRVLIVDWDLEAPGLERFFLDFEIQNKSKGAGLLDLLYDAKETFSKNKSPNWKKYISTIDVGGEHPISLLTSGKQGPDYAGRVLGFNWGLFFENSGGGDFIESLRKEWRTEYDVTLIDSRTGFTDSGGICTIQLPDILALVFTTNKPSLQGAKDAAQRAQKARQKLAFDRMPLLIFPLPSRFDSRAQFEESQEWLEIFAEELAPFYDDWLPKKLTPRQIIERTKLPYIGFFSFGEKLSAATAGVTDPEGLGYAYMAAATLIAGDFDNAEELITEGNQDLKSEKDLGFLPDLRSRLISTRFMFTAILLVAVFLAGFAWLLFKRSSKGPVLLTLCGSETIGINLAPKLAETFMAEKGAADISTRATGQVKGSLSDGSDFNIKIDSSGSETAFSGLESGRCDIGMSSRKITDSEIRFLGPLGDMTSPEAEHILALDGAVIVVNRSNPISSLTTDQLKDIFTGKIDTWSQLNKENEGRINIYLPDQGSGILDSFDTLVPKNERLADRITRFENIRELSKFVETDINGIGYVVLPFVGGNRAVAISEGSSSPLLPNRITILTEDYPLTRHLYLYTAPNPSAMAKDFVEFSLSKVGQEIVQTKGFFTQTIVIRDSPEKIENAPSDYQNLARSKQRLSIDFKFGPSSAELDNKGLRDVDRLVDFLTDSPRRKPEVILVGFSDGPNFLSNGELAKERALSVADQLRRRGIDYVTIMGFRWAPESSKDPGKNRRVEVWVR